MIRKLVVFLLIFSIFSYYVYSIDSANTDTEDKVEDKALAKKELEEAMSQYADKVIKDNGRIVKIISFDGSYDMLYYGKQNDKVERIDTYSFDGKLMGTIVFYRDSKSGKTLAIKHGNNRVYFVDVDDNRKTYIRSNGDENDEYNTFFSSLILQGVENDDEKYEYTESGNLVIHNKDGISEYDKNGKILREQDRQYSYNEDGKLESISLFSSGELIEKELYSDNELSSKEFYKNSKISKKILYHSSGNEEEYYENGLIYARAFYAPDNKKVISIEYI